MPFTFLFRLQCRYVPKESQLKTARRQLLPGLLPRLLSTVFRMGGGARGPPGDANAPRGTKRMRDTEKKSSDEDDKKSRGAFVSRGWFKHRLIGN